MIHLALSRMWRMNITRLQCKKRCQKKAHEITVRWSRAAVFAQLRRRRFACLLNGSHGVTHPWSTLAECDDCPINGRQVTLGKCYPPGKAIMLSCICLWSPRKCASVGEDCRESLSSHDDHPFDGRQEYSTRIIHHVSCDNNRPLNKPVR